VVGFPDRNIVDKFSLVFVPVYPQFAQSKYDPVRNCLSTWIKWLTVWI